MATYKLLALAFVCAPSVFATLSACENSPTRAATGEEIEAAVQQAERERAQARAKRPLRPADQTVLASALPY